MNASNFVQAGEHDVLDLTDDSDYPERQIGQSLVSSRQIPTSFYGNSPVTHRRPPETDAHNILHPNTLINDPATSVASTATVLPQKPRSNRLIPASFAQGVRRPPVAVTSSDRLRPSFHPPRGLERPLTAEELERDVMLSLMGASSFDRTEAYPNFFVAGPSARQVNNFPSTSASVALPSSISSLNSLHSGAATPQCARPVPSSFLGSALDRSQSLKPVVMPNPTLRHLGYQQRPQPLPQLLLTNRDSQQALQAVIQSLQGLSTEQKDPPEGSLLVPMMLHQKLALAWMCGREAGNGPPFGGMLCDDQGLGKTVSTMALIVTNTREAPEQQELARKLSPHPGGHANGSSPPPPAGGTLIICPTSVMNQWYNEIMAKVAPSAFVTVHKYHGTGRHQELDVLCQYSVVLTTFTTVANEAPERQDDPKTMKKGLSKDVPIELTDSDEEARPAKKGRHSSKGGPLFHIQWQRVVLDEAQAIKNARTLVAHAAWNLKANCRWCLSGTPIQNSVDDMYSYFRFLQVPYYSSHRNFKKEIKDVISADSERGYKKLQALLTGILLRRTKQSKINGEPIVKLPARNEYLMRTKFSADEQSNYERLHKESKQQVKELENSGSVQQRYVNMLLILLRLRQACNHPNLGRGSGTAAKRGGNNKPSAAQLNAAKKLEPGHREALLSVLSTPSDPCGLCNDIPEDPVVSACGHIFCDTCIHMRVDGSASTSAERELLFHCPLCNTAVSQADVYTQDTLHATQDSSSNGGARANGSASCTRELWQSSAKVDALMQLLEDIRQGRDKYAAAASSKGGPPEASPSRNALLPRGNKSAARLAAALGGASSTASPVKKSGPSADKVIVFTQWTRMLDLLETPLKHKKFVFRRLDGSMTLVQRDKAIADFQTKDDISVLIVSLKAASVGLNLTCANHVVLMDLWWNPTVEDQAIDRAHRIGQTKPVHVTRITIEGSIEDRILDLQNQKRKVVEATFGAEGSANGSNRLTLQDLTFLFS